MEIAILITLIIIAVAVVIAALMSFIIAVAIVIHYMDEIEDFVNKPEEPKTTATPVEKEDFLDIPSEEDFKSDDSLDFPN